MIQGIRKEILFREIQNMGDGFSHKKEESYREALAAQNKKVIVLDDDPTGVQTVHDVYVYTEISRESIRRGMEGKEQVFYLLTNSRALQEEETEAVHKQIGIWAAEEAERLGVDFLIISRGDSTLRGHYPIETAALREGLLQKGKEVDGEIVCPFFQEGGRFTAEDIHYVETDPGTLTPAGETEFAEDATFGYQNSDLKGWIEEKSCGRIKKEQVTAISIQELREYRISEMLEKLMGASDFKQIIVNAVSYEDLKVFMTVLVRALKAGKYFLFRTAASFVKILGGFADRPLLSSSELYRGREEKAGGLIVVGSHVKKTTEQLAYLRKSASLHFLEFSVEEVEKAEKLEEQKRRILEKTEELLQKGERVVIYTGRKRREAQSGKSTDHLALSLLISEAVTDLVKRLSVKPRYLIAKGGITSSEIGTKALLVKRAFVPGQLLPGIPVWITGEESRFPDIPYVIFPGNVGSEEALLCAVKKFEASRPLYTGAKK